MIQTSYKFVPIISSQIKLMIQIKTTLIVQFKITPLFYMHLILMSYNHLKHKHPPVKIMTHLRFHLNSQLKHTHNSPQQGSSHTQHTKTVNFQTPIPPSPHEIQTSTYTPAQSNPVQNVQTSSNFNTIHSNPPSNYTTSRHLSRPPLQPILTNPLSYNLTSTNSRVIYNNLQQTITDPIP